MSDIVVRMYNIDVRYSESDKPALQIEELEIRRGETLLVLGRSGSGKSTLGKVISGVVPHIEKGEIRGTLKVCEIDPRTVEIEKIVRKVAYLAQSPYDQVIFTKVIDELKITIENIRGYVDESEVEKYLKILGIEHLKNRNIRELSGGELQKLAIACILAIDPEIVILDEPLAHLDPQSCKGFLEIVKKMRDLEKTLIIIEHRFRELIDLIENSLIDRIALLNNCRLLMVLDSNDIIKNLSLLDELGIILPINCKLALALGVELRGLKDYTVLELALKKLADSRDLDKEEIDVNNNVLEVKNLYAGYISKFRGLHRSIIWILKNININVKRREIVGIVGPNGAGKSTLLRSILRIVPHVRGIIIINGKRVRSLCDLRGLVGYVPQNPDLVLSHDTVFKEIFERAKISHRNIRDAEKLVIDLAREFDLSDVLHRCPHSLSRGQRFRVAIASVLALEPALLLLDEPTVGQDEDCIEKLGQIIRNYVKNDRGIIVVTHDLHFIVDYVDRIYVINNGQIVAEGDPIEVMTSGIFREVDLPVPDYIEYLKKFNINIRPREIIEKARSLTCNYAS
ncbi:MAG: ATP-binding cassette domain-containing protein [Crenarchaeota archaeon]|nr:ATP-binding cassette domain-containing protein [Thermoproteota archaeon]